MTGIFNQFGRTSSPRASSPRTQKATNHPATFSPAELIEFLRCAVELHWQYVDGAEGPVASTMDLWHGDHGVQHRFSVIVC